MTKTISINKVEIKMGKMIVPLTLKQVKDLQDTLNEAFPSEKEPITLTKYVPWYQREYYPLQWIDQRPTYTGTSITCSVDGSTARFII